MRRLALVVAALALVPVSTGAEAPAAPGELCGAKAAAATAPAVELLTGYGSGGFAVRTGSRQAQAFFDNGMQLGHAFAHKASIAAFKQASRIDPGCAMCAWGEAWASGPTLNYTIDAARQKELAALADRAAALAKDGPALEQRMTSALKLRYQRGGGTGAGDLAFAKAMDQLAHEHPEDNELAVIAADAWMIPAANKEGRENLDKALGLLEGALKRNPKDTGAIHFYIHATEMNGETAKALPYAQELQALAPSASHLVHMPSHTFFWVGRYEAAATSNLDASVIDEANAGRLKTPDGPWGLDYHSHNVTFGTAAALMAGDADKAMKLARPAVQRLGKSGGVFTIARAYFAFARFGSAAEVAALADPGAERPFLRAMWHYARGEAAARRGDLTALKTEIDGLRALQGSDQTAAATQIARLTLQGRAAMLERNWSAAAGAFREAAEIQEKRLAKMTDPPGWWFPVRRALASAELAAGRPDRAASEARAVLKRQPGDPMTLLVLSRAQAALGDRAQARRTFAEGKSAWAGGVLELGPIGA